MQHANLGQGRGARMTDVGERICTWRTMRQTLPLRSLASCALDSPLQEVRWFWSVAHELASEQQKRLLAFVTGSDRVPIKGLGALNPPFVISRCGRLICLILAMRDAV
jgi:hypothetical protein